MPRNRKGAKLERELVNELDDAGFAVMRAPSSGAATDRALPDVLAGNGETFVAIEAKASKEQPIYIDEEEIVALEFFAENFGAQPLIGVRFNREPWYFFAPEDVYTTNTGNYRVKKETALSDGVPMSDLTSDGGEE